MHLKLGCQVHLTINMNGAHMINHFGLLSTYDLTFLSASLLSCYYFVLYKRIDSSLTRKTSMPFVLAFNVKAIILDTLI